MMEYIKDVSITKHYGRTAIYAMRFVDGSSLDFFICEGHVYTCKYYYINNNNQCLNVSNLDIERNIEAVIDMVS